MPESLSVENTLANIEKRWAPANRQLLRQMFAALADGTGYSTAQLAERIGVHESDAREALDFPTVGVVDDRLVELFGFMLAPTMQRVVVDGRALFACCALVAHAMSPILDKPLDVESVDPTSREVVRLTVHPNGSVTHDPQARATIVVSPPDWGDCDVRDAFCSHIRHFATEQSAQAFAQLDTRRTVVSVGHLHELGTKLAHSIWG